MGEGDAEKVISGVMGTINAKGDPEGRDVVKLNSFSINKSSLACGHPGDRAAQNLLKFYRLFQAICARCFSYTDKGENFARPEQHYKLYRLYILQKIISKYTLKVV